MAVLIQADQELGRAREVAIDQNGWPRSSIAASFATYPVVPFLN
jgi:hypothetical protein